MRFSRGVLAAVLLGMLSIAATRFVAMRVELEPVRPEGSATAAVLVVQVAPEDRSRIGRTAWLEGEIRRGDAVVARLARAAELDSNGAVRLEMVLEPGAYEVRVELRSGSGRDTGIWEGVLTVPRLEGGVAPTPSPTPQPTPAPSAPPPAAAVDSPEEGAAPEAPAPADSPPVPEASVEEPAPTRPPEAPPAPVVPPPPTEARAADPEPTEPADSAPAPFVPVPVPEAPVPTAADPAPAAPPRASALEPDLAGWGRAQPGMVDLTAIVTDRDRPVLGLGRRDFAVEVSGDSVVPEAIGGAGEAPLMLGLAIDASRSMADEMGEVRALAGRLSLRASGGRGQIMLVRSDDGPRVVADWGASSADLAAALTGVGSADEANLADLVTSALASFEGRAGRRVLLVVVDGGDTASRADWKAAADAAEGAAIPVLVIGFKGETLDDRTRSALERVTDLSGGKDYWLTLRDTGLLNLVSEHFGELLDASYAIRVRRPAGARAEKLKVETLAKGLDVRHSRRIR